MNWLATTALTNAIAATLLAVVVCALSRCCRRPALSHHLWVIVLLKFLTPPLVEIPVGWKLDFASQLQPLFEHPHAPSSAIEPATAVAKQPSALPPSPIVPSPKSTPVAAFPTSTELLASKEPAIEAVPVCPVSSAIAGRPFDARRVAFLLATIWLVGIVTSLIVLARRTWSFQDFIHRAGHIDKALCRRVQSLAQAAGLKSAPEVIAVRGIVSPMLWGIGHRIRLVFPTTLLQKLPSAACDTLLLHELAHFARGDQWVRLVELVAQVLFWWHPVVWWARREIEAAEEQCCDAWVVMRQAGSRRTYAEALLATIDFLCEQPALLPPAASGLGGADLLRIRLTQIMRGELAASLTATAKLSVFVLAAFLLPLGPALFGASIRPLPALPTKPDKPIQTSVDEHGVAGIAQSSALRPHVSDQAPATAPNTTVVAAIPPSVIRPAPAITAIATSRNGKYRLERRKGSHVTLVSEPSGWRLDMSTHGILCVAFTPDSRQFVTGHSDGVVRVWDSETGGLAASLKGCTDAVWSVAVAQLEAANCQVAAGAKDGSVLVWNLASGDELARLPPSESSVSCLRWSSRGEALAISFGDFSNREPSSLLLWSPLDHQMLAQLNAEKPVAALSWLPNDEGLLMADWKGDAHVWRLDSQTLSPVDSLGKSGKERAEAANWSADCPLATPPVAELLTLGAE
jgi:beta-lactamase regulating signal transducer with metallopeptidase domain